MGRGRTSLNRIEDEKIRKTTLMNRSTGLMKKVSEISTKCDVEACLIVYDGDKDGNSPPMTWPNDTRVVKSLLEKYELQKNENPPPKLFDLKDYYNNRERMSEAEISRVKKEILKIKYPTPCFNNTGKEELSDFIAMIDAKIGACSERINMLKTKQESELANFSFRQNMQTQQQDQFVASSSVSHPNQFSLMQNMIMQQHSERNRMVGFTNQVAVEPMHWPFIQSHEYQVLLHRYGKI